MMKMAPRGAAPRVPGSTRADSREPEVSLVVKLVGFFLVGAVLYWASALLIPLALAILVSFLLDPLVVRLDRAGLGRIPAVLSVVALASVLVGALLWLFVSQLNHLATDLPTYRENISSKIASLQDEGEFSALGRLERSLTDLADELERPSPESAPEPSPGEPEEVGEPTLTSVPVRVVEGEDSRNLLSRAWAYLAPFQPALKVLATAGWTIVLVIFMLIQREDLRNRLVSLTSRDSLATTTRALDDAGHRISRYLLMQFLINASMGLAVALGLFFIGVPYALLWGLFSAVFRYVPYVGSWAAALLPIAVSVMSSPGWTQALLVVGLFLTLELLSNNLLEPWLYGRGVGVSLVALIFAAAFWTWIWGPAGLVLATPLTVCLVVAGKYVPALGFFDRMLGEDAALPPHVVFVQRLLARDPVEAALTVRAYRDQHGDEVFDDLLVPALALVRKERADGGMAAEDEQFVVASTSEILETSFLEPSPDEGAASVDSRSAIVGCPAHHEMERLALVMLERVGAGAEGRMKVLSSRTLPSDVISTIVRERPRVVVVSVTPPGGFEQALYLCRQVRKRSPKTGIIVGVWGFRGELDRIIVKFRAAGAHYVTTTLSGALSHIRSMAPPSTVDRHHASTSSAAEEPAGLPPAVAQEG